MKKYFLSVEVWPEFNTSRKYLLSGLYEMDMSKHFSPEVNRIVKANVDEFDSETWGVKVYAFNRI